MLRSLSKRLLGRDRAAGLMVGRNRLGFASVAFNGAGPQVVRIDERKLDFPLFAGRPSDDTTAALAEALKELAPEAVNQYLPLHVSLPGAAVRLSVLSLDALPKTHAEHLDLVRWHFAQTTNAEHALACDCEPVGTEEDKHLLLGFAVDRAWHDCIVDALNQAGMTAWSMNADVCRQYNYFHERLNEKNEGGALFAATPDAWSLLLWDESGRIRYGSSRWRTGGADEYAGIAAEVERRILAAIATTPAMRVAQLHVAVSGEDAGLAEAFDARLREPCIRLAPETAWESDNPDAAGCVPASVAAALQS